jgi:excisionase family DNA binding protein
MSNSAENTETLLTPKQAARQLGTTLAFIYHEIASNHFPGAKKVENRWLIPASDVEVRALARRARGITW